MVSGWRVWGWWARGHVRRGGGGRGRSRRGRRHMGRGMGRCWMSGLTDTMLGGACAAESWGGVPYTAAAIHVRAQVNWCRVWLLASFPTSQSLCWCLPTPF